MDRRISPRELIDVEFFEAPEWAQPEAHAVARITIARGLDVIRDMILDGEQFLLSQKGDTIYLDRTECIPTKLHLNSVR